MAYPVVRTVVARNVARFGLVQQGVDMTADDFLIVANIIMLVVAVIVYAASSSQITKSTKAIIKETTLLRDANRIILLAMENQGLADLRRDGDGEIIGLNIRVFPGDDKRRYDAQGNLKNPDHE
jgi:hypothetical protein